MGSALEILDGSGYVRQKANVTAARRTQQSGNERRGAEAAAQATIRALGNRRMMDAAGERVNAITENTARNLDAASSGRLSQRIGAAEALGAVSAQAAALGVGGSSAEIFKSTMRLKTAIGEEGQDRAIKSAVYADNVAADDAIMSGSIGLDNTVDVANIDNTQYVDPQKMSGLAKAAAFAAAGAATYFGGPQAGMAVLDVAAARQRNMNGDFAGAGAKLDTAAGRAIAGAQMSRSLAEPGKTWGSWWDNVFNKSNDQSTIKKGG